MNNDEIIALKEKFDNFEINEKDLSEEQKKKIANLYFSEIEKMRSHIRDLNSQIDSYKRKIEALKRQ